MPWLAERARAELADIAAAERTRLRQTVGASRADGQVRCADGQWRRVFCSNDYLGLAGDPRLAAAAAGADASGARASQHVCGYHAEQAALEAELAAVLGVPRVLVGGSGYALNSGAIAVLAGAQDQIYSDALNHASLIDGCRLSRARVQRYAHADLADLQAHMDSAARPAAGQLIVTDALFSMDGDVAPLAGLLDLARRRDAALYVDDAHGFGWAGPGGSGHLAAAGLADARVVQLVTFGKALGGYGAALAGEADIIEWLLQRCRTTMFATALPPAVCAAARAALRICAGEPEHAARLRARIALFRREAAAAGLRLLPSQSPIQALLLGAESRALAWQQGLWQRGYWVNAIRPPTVPAGTARLRITLSAAQAEADVRGLVAALAELQAAETALSA